jgi:hypothetical protein
MGVDTGGSVGTIDVAAPPNNDLSKLDEVGVGVGWFATGSDGVGSVAAGSAWLDTRE